MDRGERRQGLLSGLSTGVDTVEAAALKGWSGITTVAWAGSLVVLTMHSLVL